MKAYVFPGQGAQFEGMGKDLYAEHAKAKQLFEHANEVLGYALSDIMFEGDAEALKQTKITQPALFVHGLAKLTTVDDFDPIGVAGHSLGEFTALVAAGAMSFEDGLRLVYARAMAMQEACEIEPGTMAAVLGLDDAIVEEICSLIPGVVAANYNCPGQLVISGTLEGVQKAAEALKEAGAKRALLLPVGGAFHSPLMQPAKEKLAQAIEQTTIHTPICPIYQNVDALPTTSPEVIRKNLINQLTGPVRWTQTIQHMAKDGIATFVECGGTGKVLGGLIKKINPEAITESL